MATIRAIARAMRGAEVRYLDVVTYRISPDPMWTRPSVHTHNCIIRVELADDGQPLSDFANWPSLVRAADLAEGKLRIRVDPQL